MRLVLKEYLTHYKVERPHQGVGNVPLAEDAKTPKPAKGRVNCRKRLGGFDPALPPFRGVRLNGNETDSNVFPLGRIASKDRVGSQIAPFM